MNKFSLWGYSGLPLCIYLICFYLLTVYIASAQQDIVREVTLKATATITRSGPVAVSFLKIMTFTQEEFPEDGKMGISPVEGKNTTVVMATGPPGTMGYLRYFQKEPVPAGISETLHFLLAANPVYDQLSSAVINQEMVFTLNDLGKYYIWIGLKVPMGKKPFSQLNSQLTIEIEYL